MEKTVERLRALVESLIARATSHAGINEGVVMTEGKTPYRRLDCDGRALAYIKVRAKKRAVRVDVSGLWSLPRCTHLAIPSATGAALLICSEDDVLEAVQFLVETVDRTRIIRARRAEHSAGENGDR